MRFSNLGHCIVLHLEVTRTITLNIKKFHNLTSRRNPRQLPKKFYQDRSFTCDNPNDFCRSSRSQMFFKIYVLKHFANFTGKHLCWSLILRTFQFWRLATHQKEAPTQVFFCEICEIFKTPQVAASDGSSWFGSIINTFIIIRTIEISMIEL